MRHLLIDANIYLGFYRFSKDDLEELRKLAELVRQGEIVLYVNKQLRDEVRRNRESVLADSLKKVSDSKIPSAFPQILRNYKGFPALDAARTAFAAEIDNLLSRAREDAASRSLPADLLIDELMSLGTDLEITEAIVAAAKDRVDRGNPPGKNGSYGDAITWQALLAYHPDALPLDLVSADSDYFSQLRPSQLQEFLEREWDEVKFFSEITLYENLTTFFQVHYPNIKLSTQVASEIAVARLEASGSFATTHKAIAGLAKVNDFSNEEVQRLVDAALSNDQVTKVLQDPDVKEFYEGFLGRFAVDALDPDSVENLQALLKDEDLF